MFSALAVLNPQGTPQSWYRSLAKVLVWRVAWSSRAHETPQTVTNVTPRFGPRSPRPPYPGCLCVAGSWRRPGEHGGQGETRVLTWASSALSFPTVFSSTTSVTALDTLSPESSLRGWSHWGDTCPHAPGKLSCPLTSPTPSPSLCSRGSRLTPPWGGRLWGHTESDTTKATSQPQQQPGT